MYPESLIYGLIKEYTSESYQDPYSGLSWAPWVCKEASQMAGKTMSLLASDASHLSMSDGLQLGGN